MERIPSQLNPSENPSSPESLTEELPLEEKRLIADAWSVGVTGVSAPDNPEAFSNEEMKAWLEHSLMEGISHFADDVGIKPNEKILDGMKHAETLEKRVATEEQYLKDIQEQMNTVKNRAQAERGRRETRWDSWPTVMREHQTWNCVGGTLIAMHLLQDTGIRNYNGSAPGHVLNIIQLSNGDWWYADFTNNSVFKIEPDEGAIGEMKTITLKDKRARYEFIGISDSKNITKAVLGNLASMRKESADPEKEGPGKDNAVEEMRKFGHLFSEAPFSNTQSALYPAFKDFYASEAYKNESERIKRLDYETDETKKVLEGFVKPIAEATARMTSEEISELQEMFREHIQDIEALLVATPEEAKRGLEELNLPDKLTELIAIRINQLHELLSSGNDELYDTLLRHTIRRWHST